jgi:hypothetical protein
LKQARFTKPARSELLGQTAYYEAIEKALAPGSDPRSKRRRNARLLSLCTANHLQVVRGGGS